MAGRTKREICDQDVQGLKCLRKIRPLLSRLRNVGVERDRAGNRRLFMDQYCALILMSLFSPAIQSLRDLQRASTLDKVRKRLGVNRASLGSLSESVAIFDPAPLKEIAAELGHTISSKTTGRFAAVGQSITAVDGTVIETVKRVAELAWTPLADRDVLPHVQDHFPTRYSGRGARALRAGVAGQRSHGWRSAGSFERAKAWRAESECPATGHGHLDPHWTLASPSKKQLSNTGHLGRHVSC